MMLKNKIGDGLRVNREIRAPRVRVISSTGEQIGILTVQEALSQAMDVGMDLVEISPTATPPVCKIIDYGKFRYDQTKREKESKKSQHQIKVKEIKVKPNIGLHDLEIKLNQARSFLVKGNKVKVTCMFRGREMAHPEIGQRIMQKFCDDLEDVSLIEAPPKLLGRLLSAVLAPGSSKKKKEGSKQSESKQPEKE